MLSNILFDLDGTLTDPKEGITNCIRFALEQIGAPVPETGQLTWCIGPSLRESFSVLLKTKDNETIEQALSLYRKRFSDIGMFENTVYPDIICSLERLYPLDLNLFVATAKPRFFAQKILDHFRLTPFFAAVYGSELNGHLSDKSALVAHILNAENLEPEKTMIVGDRVYDIVGGKNNNIHTAAVRYGYGSADEIEASNPDMIFDTFTLLADFLESSYFQKRQP